ncbi:winged helix-turn-helix transcriptional regulator [Methanosarcina sp. WWM596]|uniref:helix-turn-helix transcriptional regulator n=1 Tax=Methanosarcina sp. WWM596 TaxID=1434103 RepID=UPI000AFD63D7|nr:winged helix-turn-helix transcriptional regulator [Methanosarcina sp. WWM596]
MCVQGNALAVTIHGTVYEWYSFKPLENSIVEINSTPEQSFVATDAKYSFNLTPGTYLITANYFEEDTIVYTAKEEFIVSDTDEGEYVRDLLLFPAYQEDLLNQGEDFENVDLNFEQVAPQFQTEHQSQASSQNTVLAFALLSLCILLIAGYFLKKGKRKPPEKAAGSQGKTETINESEPENFTIAVETPGSAEPGKAGSIEASETDYEHPASLKVEEQTGNISETEIPVQQNVKLPEDSTVSINPLSEDINPLSEDINPLSEDINPSEEEFEFDSLSPNDLESPETNLPDDLKEILNLIRGNGNRITQRELRKKSPYSESKVSLMLSDLEERGLVEKFKRGRGNIIRIPDGEVIKQAGSQSKKEQGENSTL